MDDYEVQSHPFYGNADSHVYLFHGRRRADDLPVVLKRHDFGYIQLQDTQKEMNSCLNAVLLQAKLQHPNVCEVLEVSLEIDKSSCSIYHVLEALDTDLAKDINERTKDKRSFTETEVRDIATQTATALAYAHCLHIAHRDIKPSNIFRRGSTYKLGDFGCFFLKRDTSYTHSPLGDQRYMSPQIFQAFMRGTQYNAFKSDVYALGASLLHVVTGRSPQLLLQTDYPSSAVRDTVQGLSLQLQDLLMRMVAVEEGDRPTMQEVCAQLAAPVPLAAAVPAQQAPAQLVHVSAGALRYFDFLTRTWGQPVPLQQNILVNINSRWVVLEDGSVFCSGGGED